MPHITSPLTPAERERVGAIFRCIWPAAISIPGSFEYSAHNRHGNYIRRGPLLLCGGYQEWTLSVIVPGDARVTPAPVNSRSNHSTLPEVDGELVLPRDTPGPWFQLLREELPIMEKEINEHLAVHAAQVASKKAAAMSTRADELRAATEACGGDS